MATTLEHIKDDDFVECFLFPSYSYDSKIEVTDEVLQETINKLNNEMTKYTKEYMWHRDPLIFHAKTKNTILLDKELQNRNSELEEFQLPPHIYSSLHFDEDVGDEWFLVYLIVELTKAVDGLIAKLIDTDGEFLLIETANVLPNWADPESCQDRVFIYNGQIHIIRGHYKSVIEMLRKIQQTPESFRMPEEVQTTLRNKIAIYPEEIRTRMHKARAFLPERAIAVLKQDPSLIAAALRSVCRSDPLERKVCRAMKYFPPEQRAMVNVKMTRCLYAMASHCRYAGDSRTGWNLPSRNDSKWNVHLLGVKIACGLEMLVARANQESKSKTENEDMINQNKNEWSSFVSRLISNGYFRDYLEGSQEYNRLMQQAQEYFKSNSSSFSTVWYTDEASRVLKAWRDAPRYEEESMDEGRLSPADKDDWLQVDPAELQSMLDQHWSSNERMVDQKPLTFQNKIKDFLSQSSDVEGIPFARNSTSNVTTDQDNNASKTNMDIDESTKIEFNVEAFDSALRGILDLVVPGDDDEFDSSSEGSLGGDNEDKNGELDEYMKLLDSQLALDLHMSALPGKRGVEKTSNDVEMEENFKKSAEEEAGGAGPVGNIIGGPVHRHMHLHLQSPSSVPTDLQS